MGPNEKITPFLNLELSPSVTICWSWQYGPSTNPVVKHYSDLVTDRTTQNIGGETNAKYEMLMTWLKRTPRAADKVGTV